MTIEARNPGWYELVLALDEPRDEYFLLDLGMADIPRHLGAIHLPKPDPDGLIRTIVWVRSVSRRLEVIDPDSALPVSFALIRDRAIHPMVAFARMLWEMHQKSAPGEEGRLSFTLGKNGARLRKKGLNGMVVRAYKDYYRFRLGQGSVRTDEARDYDAWVRKYDQADDLKRQHWRQASKRLRNGPLISVIMPVFNPDPRHLRAAIESVCAQIYDRWELCIADDCSTERETARILAEFAGKDQRIRLVRTSRNAGISSASNAALKIAAGDWITFLDHDDLLREQSLLRLAETIVENPGIRFLYTDEDKIDDSGQRQQPHFKPDWNPELFRAVNYVCHLAAYRREIVEKAGGLRPACDGAQDYDLALRVTRDLDSSEIFHLPEVLYHWRISHRSTAADANNKQYASDSGRKALADALCSAVPGASVSAGAYPTTYRVAYPLPQPLPRVSIIIPTRNAEALVRQCINSIRERTAYPNYEIIVVDNGSTEPAAIEYFSRLNQTGAARILPLDIPFNYSRLNNHAVRQTRGEIIVLLNNDIEVISPHWLDEMVSLASRPGTGAVGAKLLYPDGRVQHGGVILGIGGVAGHAHKYLDRFAPGYFGRLQHRQNLSAVTGACLAVRKSVYLEVGGMNEKDLAVAFNDVDFCLRLMEAGHENVWTPHAELYHHESVSRGAEDTPEKQKRFSEEVQYMQKRWGDLLAHDPFYNPNLTIDAEDFGLAFPPRRRPAPNTPNDQHGPERALDGARLSASTPTQRAVPT